jgi:antitoxin PrlF
MTKSRSMEICEKILIPAWATYPRARPDARTAKPRGIARGAVSCKAVSHITAMNRPTPKPTAFSKVSIKSQTVLPRKVRDKLGIKPGDTLRYRLTEDGILIDKAPAEANDPFAAFSEWSSAADEKAYADL